MSCSWPIHSLEDVAEDITVGFVGPMAHEYQSTGIPFLRSQNVEPFKIDLKDIKYISADFHKKIQKSALKPMDVVIVRTGKPGACAVVPKWLKEANCSDLVIVKPGPQLDSFFLMYYVNSIASHQVNSYLVGAVQQHFNVGSARQIKLKLPSLEIQKQITNILTTLDDKIELNRQMNETLEALVRAVFKSWFVDFDPVRAKMEGKLPAGMDAETAALFPSEFEEVEGREVPKGWKVGAIGDVVSIVGGSTPSTKNPEFWENGTINFVTPKDLASSVDPILLDTEKKISDKGVEQISSRILPLGTVLLSSRAPIGYIVLTRIQVSINQGFIAIICNKILPNYFVINWLKTNLQAIIDRANGTTFLEISKSNFKPMEVIVPDSRILDKFVQTVSPLYLKIENNAIQSRTLINIRDLLLPKLLSGEIEVSNICEVSE